MQVEFIAVLEKEAGIKLHRSQWSKIETGAQALTIELLPTVCKVLGCSLDQLVLGIEPQNSRTFSFDANDVASIVDSLDGDLKLDVVRFAHRANEIQTQRRCKEQEIYRLKLLLNRSTTTDDDDLGEDEGYIYFISSPEREVIKIGFSTNPQNRLRSLATASPYALEFLCVIPGDTNYEKSLHDKFHHLRQSGEWFSDTQEIREFIESLNNGA